jgi:DNA transformation protein and related proteins
VAVNSMEALETLSALPGLGQVSAHMLIEAGIPNADELRRLGPLDSYRRLRFRHGRRVTVNFIYALECAIENIHWRNLTTERKIVLKGRAHAIDLELERGRQRSETR